MIDQNAPHLIQPRRLRALTRAFIRQLDAIDHMMSNNKPAELELVRALEKSAARSERACKKAGCSEFAIKDAITIALDDHADRLMKEEG